MTSVSRSEGRRRGLAVYQTPPPPDGYHGSDLIRIVDPLGLSMAWLGTGRAMVVALFARDRAEASWQPLLMPAAGAPAGRFDPGEEHPWQMTHRDPVSASFVSERGHTIHYECRDAGLEVRIDAECAFITLAAGSVTIETSHDAGQTVVFLGLPVGGRKG